MTTMPTYIVLWNWTDQGIRNVKEAPERVEAFRQAIEKLGGKLESLYYTMGEFDGMARIDAPSDEAWMKIAYSLGRSGNVRTRTLKALSASEAAKLIGQL